MSNDDLAHLFVRVLLVRENPRQRIGEYGNRLGKAHVVLPQVGSSFAWVPFEDQRHGVYLQNTRDLTQGCVGRGAKAEPGSLAGTQGFEPRYAAPEAAVLPLDDVPTQRSLF